MRTVFVLAIVVITQSACAGTVTPDAIDSEIEASFDSPIIDTVAPPFDAPADRTDVIDVRDATVLVREDGATWSCSPSTCTGHLLECADCVDNDGDGLVDSHDPDCMGPCDNAEETGLSHGVDPGGLAFSCVNDSYFDVGTGTGNDGCKWDSRCDPLETAPAYSPNGPGCAYDATRIGGDTCPATQSSTCREVWLPLTPNGCDCFGCCTFPRLAGLGPGGGPGYVWIASRSASGDRSCTLENVTDPAACHPCTPVTNCLNECGPCEVCLGRPLPSADCSSASDSSPAATRCGAGVQPCGLPGESECPAAAYCVTGCCEPVPL